MRNNETIHAGRNHAKFRLLGSAAVAAVLMVFLLLLPGCAVGRNAETGAIVLGVEAGRLVETTNQAIAGLADMVLPGAGGAVGLLALAAGGWARSHAKASAERAAREAADREWEAAERQRREREHELLLAASDPATASRVISRPAVVPPVPPPAGP